MFENTLKRMREMVRGRQYFVTVHARKEMLDDELSMDDVELAFLSGSIQERQRDANTSEWKYRLAGEATDARPVEVVAKFSPTGKLVVITVYVL
jgi:hypothetical protein